MERSGQVFLQFLMHRGAVKDEEAKEMHEVLEESYPTGLDFADYIFQLSNRIEPFSLTIRRAVYKPEGNQLYWGLSNTSSDEVSLKATTFTDNERRVLQKLVVAILDSETDSVSKMKLNSFGRSENVLIGQCEVLLDKVVKGKWFRVHGNEISMGPRAEIDLFLFMDNRGGGADDNDSQATVSA